MSLYNVHDVHNAILQKLVSETNPEKRTHPLS